MFLYSMMNQEIFSLIQLGATNSPSVETLTRACEYIQQNKLLVEDQGVTLAQKVTETNSPAELRALLQPRPRSMFNR